MKTEDAAGIDLRFCAEELSELYASSSMGLGVLDAELRYLRVNARLAAMNGRDEESHVGRSVEEVVPALAGKLRPLLDAALAGRPTRNFRLEGETGDQPGINRTWICSFLPLRDEDGAQAVSMIMDELSDRQRFEERLRQERAALTRMADALPVILLVLDSDLALRFANRPWYDYVGCADPEAGDSPDFREIVHPSDLAAVESLFSNAVDPGQVMSCEARLRATDNRYRWYLVEAQQTGSELGRTWEALITCVDIEEQKRSAQELARKSEALQEQDRKKDQFLAILGHEIRNPLAAMANAVTSLAMKQDEAWALDVLREQMKMLGLLVDDLLDDARIRQGRIELRLDHCDLQPILRLSIETLRESARSAGVTLEQEGISDPIWLEADRTRLQQVFTNLVRNAVKFSERAGKVSIRVDTSEDRVIVAVRDAGKGIPKHMLDRIFDPFVQLSGNERYPDRGLGVGLSLVRDLVGLHGGEVRAASEGVGQGSTFTVVLPMLEGAELAAAEERRAEQRPDAPAATAALTVLLVDDNDVGRTGLARILRAYGLEVHEAACAEDAMALARRETFDVAVLDIGLPDRSGYELAAELRETPQGPSLKLIAVSGYARQRDRESDEFDDHLLKPVDLEELLDGMGIAR